MKRLLCFALLILLVGCGKYLSKIKELKEKYEPYSKDNCLDSCCEQVDDICGDEFLDVCELTCPELDYVKINRNQSGYTRFNCNMTKGG